MSISKYPRVRVHWIDILGDTSWADEDEFQEMKCSTCVSEGHLFHKDDNFVMTFASYEIEDGEIMRRRQSTGAGAQVHIQEIPAGTTTPVVLGSR